MSTHLTSSDTDRGFSLLEILVVITVLGVLATVVLFAVRGGADDAEAAAVAADARVLETAEAAFAISTGRYGDEDELVAAGFLRQPSDLHDIVLEGDGFRLVRTDGAGESADDGAPGDDRDGESAGPGTTSTTAPPVTTVPVTTAPVTTVPMTTVPVTTVPVTTAPVTTAPVATVPVTTAPVAGAVTCALTVTQAWGTGANADLTVKNASERRVTAWTVEIDARGDRISLWNATTHSSRPESVIASNLRWNGTIAAGSTATPTGASIQGDGLEVGRSYPCRVITPEPSPDEVRCGLDVTRTWPGGGSVRLTVANEGTIDVSSWTVAVAADGVAFTNWSGADVTEKERGHLTLTSQDWTASIGAGHEMRSVTAQVAGELGKATSFDCKVVEVG